MIFKDFLINLLVLYAKHFDCGHHCPLFLYCQKHYKNYHFCERVFALYLIEILNEFINSKRG